MKFFIYALMSLFFFMGKGRAKALNRPSNYPAPITIGGQPLLIHPNDEPQNSAASAEDEIRKHIRVQKDKEAQMREEEERGLQKTNTVPTKKSIFEARKKAQEVTEENNAQNKDPALAPDNPMQLPESFVADNP